MYRCHKRYLCLLVHFLILFYFFFIGCNFRKNWPITSKFWGTMGIQMNFINIGKISKRLILYVNTNCTNLSISFGGKFNRNSARNKFWLSIYMWLMLKHLIWKILLFPEGKFNRFVSCMFNNYFIKGILIFLILIKFIQVPFSCKNFCYF